MNGTIIKDWSAVDFNSAKGRAAFFGAVQCFMSAPDNDDKLKKALRTMGSAAAVQHFTLKGDWPDEIRTVIERYRVTPSYDEGWQNIFDVRDYRSTTQSGFKLLDVSTGLTFRKILPGERVEVKKIEGSEALVTFDEYGGALGWHRSWFDDQDFWTIEDTTIEFQNQAMASRAQAYYDLLDAIGAGQNLAWQATVPAALAASDANYVAIRDFQTINKACETILLDTKAKGYAVSAATQFVLTAPIQLRDRIIRAMGVQNGLLAGDKTGVVYNVTPQFTMMLSEADKYYVSLPGRKNKAGIRMDLTLYNAFDELARVDRVAGWMRHGGAIGDVEQHQRCSVA